MRDDFPMPIKELLAKRVAFLCSQPSCGQLTSGPQLDPTKFMNVGVAAHITAASPEGPRYDPNLTPEQRRSAHNGIWLCQTCGKLVDNDPTRYSSETLHEWKMRAEARVLDLLERRASPKPVDPMFARLERLIPKLLSEMRQDLAGNPLVRECILMQRGWVFNGDGRTKLFTYFFDDHEDLTNAFHFLENCGLVHNVTFTNVTRYRFTEELVAYLDA